MILYSYCTRYLWNRIWWLSCTAILQTQNVSSTSLYILDWHHSNHVTINGRCRYPWIGLPLQTKWTLTYASLNWSKCTTQSFLSQTVFCFCSYLKTSSIVRQLGSEYVRFLNWVSDKFSGTGVITGSIQEECTKNFQNRSTGAWIMNYLNFQINLMNFVVFRY